MKLSIANKLFAVFIAGIILGGCESVALRCPCQREFTRIWKTPFDDDTNCCHHKAVAFQKALRAAGYSAWLRVLPPKRPGELQHVVVEYKDGYYWYRADPTNHTWRRLRDGE